MKVHEYQAKKLLAEFGVTVEDGVVAQSPEEIQSLIASMKDYPAYVVKAQIHAGGRGKGVFKDGMKGGVQIAHSKKEAIEIAQKMLGNVLITKQTGPHGKEVKTIYITEPQDIEKEFYLAILVDRNRRQPVILASSEGGMNIEEVAEQFPEKIRKEYVDVGIGLAAYQIRRLAYFLGLREKETQASFAKLLKALYQLFWEKNASMVEINPMVKTRDGRILALDAKIAFDDNGLAKHPEILALRDISEEDPKEVQASKFGLNYVALDGNIACLTNGAGMAMSTMDMLQPMGASPANFLDLGDSAKEDAIKEAFKIMIHDPHVEGVLVNIFGGSMKGDMVARGIIAALDGEEFHLPMVARIEGACAKEGCELLKKAIPHIVIAEGLEDAGRQMLKLLQQKR